MTILFLALWLQMSAPQLTVTTKDYSKFPLYLDKPEGLSAYGRMTGAPPSDGDIGCEIVVDQLHCKNHLGEESWLRIYANPLNDITRAEFAQRAADETDGKPLSKLRCTTEVETWRISPKECEPVDVPAVQVGYYDPPECRETKCIHAKQSCAEKSRVLLTSEDGKKHCIKF